MALKGTNSVFSVATTSGGVYTTIDGMHQGSFKINGELVDVTKFSNTYMSRLQAQKDFTISVSGFYVPTDTNGQLAVRSALVNDTDLYAKFLYDGTHGWKGQVVVNTWQVGAEVAGAQSLSIELLCAGGTITVI